MASDRPTDHDLLRAWRDGDHAAGDRLIRRHFGAVFRFFRGKVRGPQVEDLTQRTFLASLEGAARFRGDGAFRAFLLAIARNQLFMAIRSKKRDLKVFDPTEVSMRDLGDLGQASPSRMLVNKENERVLLEALRTLPLDFQITLELFYWERMKIPEIAEVLEIAHGTVKSRLGRARGMLREAIEKLADSPELARSTITDLEKWQKALRDLLGERSEG